MRTYTAKVGETCRFLLATSLGTDITGWDALCQMRSATTVLAGVDEEPDAELAITDFAGDADYGPGWYFTLSAAVSAALTAGRYRIDARITLDNAEIVYSNTWALLLEQPITETV